MLLILLMAAGALLETVFIMQSYRRRCVRSVIFKTLASACFVLLAMQCIRIRGTSDYARLVFWGLVCGLLGDALLALRFLWKKTHDVFFIAGTLAFFAGHIFYILAILKLAPDAWQYAIPLALIALGVAGFYSNAKQVKAGKIDCIYIYRMRQISGKEQHLFRFFQQVMQHGIKVVTLEYSLRDRLHEYRLGMKIENYAARHKLSFPW